MAYTFLRAPDVDTGMSLVENDKIDEAKNLLAHAADKGVRVFLPSDVVVARGISDPASAHLVPVDEIPATEMGLDIGPATVEIFADQIRDASTVVWNGPMGVFEQPAFAKGTQGVAQAVADCQGFTVIGGGDTASAIRSLGLLDDRFSHVSTGGGASLELLEGKKLPGLSILSS
jgi:phosphoglycerate kinase